MTAFTRKEESWILLSVGFMSHLIMGAVPRVMYFVAIALVVVAIICRRQFAVLLGVVQIAFGTRINPVIALQSHERTSERAQ